MSKKQLHIVSSMVSLFCVACESEPTSLHEVNMYEITSRENYSRPPSIDITSYASPHKYTREYEKIILSVVDKDKIHPIESTEATKILEMNLNDSRFNPIRRNLNDFINDANSATTIFPRGSLRYAIFGDFSIWFDDFSFDYCGYVTFIDRHGKKSKTLLFSPRLLMGYIEVGTTKNGDITYIERTINMGTFLLPHEIDVINDSFTLNWYFSD